jgi:hypothetical protein
LMSTQETLLSGFYRLTSRWKLPGLLTFKVMCIMRWTMGLLKTGLQSYRFETCLSLVAFLEQKFIISSMNFGSRAYFLRMVSFCSY